ncbi:hypothetical protein BBJ28_00022832, partial [Nothophytophthora sp. Chile5]
MLAVETHGAQGPSAGVSVTSPPPAPVRRKLDMDAGDADEVSELPTVYDLMQEVARLQQAVRDIGEDDPSLFANEFAPGGSFSAERTPPRHRQKVRTASGGSDSFSKSGIYTARKTSTNVAAMSPYKDGGAMQRSDLDSSAGLKTPPAKRRDSQQPGASRTGPRPTRVAALTRENISLLPTPARAQNFTGS